jgi:hypothetical protein
MAADDPYAFFRLNPVDRFGRSIAPAVLAAAEEIFPRAVEHGLKLLGDPAVVTDVLEEVASNSVPCGQGQGSIRQLRANQEHSRICVSSLRETSEPHQEEATCLSERG